MVPTGGDAWACQSRWITLGTASYMDKLGLSHRKIQMLQTLTQVCAGLSHKNSHDTINHTQKALWEWGNGFTTHSQKSYRDPLTQIPEIPKLQWTTSVQSYRNKHSRFVHKRAADPAPGCQSCSPSLTTVFVEQNYSRKSTIWGTCVWLKYAK